MTTASVRRELGELTGELTGSNGNGRNGQR
jgi:hypothetical protein